MKWRNPFSFIKWRRESKEEKITSDVAMPVDHTVCPHCEDDIDSDGTCSCRDDTIVAMFINSLGMWVVLTNCATPREAEALIDMLHGQGASVESSTNSAFDDNEMEFLAYLEDTHPSSMNQGYALASEPEPEPG